MKDAEKFLSPSLFLLVALCFFLPFVSFTCQGQKLATITGMELVTGTKIEKFEMEKVDEQQKSPDLDKERNVDSEPLAVAAFIFALIGIVVSIIPRYSRVISLIAGALGVLSLLFLRSSIGADLPGDSDFKILEVTYEWGYYLALILFIVAFLINLYLLRLQNKIIPDLPPADLPPGNLHLSDVVYCSKCGTPNNPENIFCEKCGHSLNP
jgi:hypothetical protein